MAGIEKGGPQPFQEKFDTGSQGGNTSGKEAADREKQKSKPFSLDLAQSINDQFMGALPDNTKLSELYKLGGGTKPQGKWHEFLQGLEPKGRSEASAVIMRLIRVGYPDIGSVRKAEIEELCEIRAIGPKRAALIKEMFKAEDRTSKAKETRPVNQTGHESRQGGLYDLPFIHNPLRKSSL